MKKFKGQVKIVYNEEEDAFELWTREDKEEWGFVMSCRCFYVADSHNPEHIHFSILRKLEEYIKLGFKLV